MVSLYNCLLGVNMDIKIKNKKSIEISHITKSEDKYSFSIKTILPKSIDLSDNISESDLVANSYITERSLHKGESVSLMLLYIKLAQKHQDSKDRFKESIKLFSYLFIKDISSWSNEDKTDTEVKTAFNDYKSIIDVFRQVPLNDEDNYITFRKLDPLISFEYEQFLLKLISFNLNKDVTDDAKKELVQEKEYRTSQCHEHKYELNYDDINNEERLARVVNQIDMQRKLLKLPLKIKEQKSIIGKRQKYTAIALSTGMIMLVFCFIILQLRLMGLDTNMQFVAAFAGMYMIRDVFKENIKDRIYKKLMKSKPIQSTTLSIPNSIEIAKTTLECVVSDNYNKLAKKNNEIIIEESGVVEKFEHNGFKKIKNVATLDLSKVIKLFPYGKKEVLITNSTGNIQKVNVQRRGRIDLILTKDIEDANKDHATTSEVYRITFDRTKIIKVERK